MTDKSRLACFCVAMNLPFESNSEETDWRFLKYWTCVVSRVRWGLAQDASSPPSANRDKVSVFSFRSAACMRHESIDDISAIARTENCYQTPARFHIIPIFMCIILDSGGAALSD